MKSASRHGLIFAVEHLVAISPRHPIRQIFLRNPGIISMSSIDLSTSCVSFAIHDFPLKPANILVTQAPYLPDGQAK